MHTNGKRKRISIPRGSHSRTMCRCGAPIALAILVFALGEGPVRSQVPEKVADAALDQVKTLVRQDRLGEAEPMLRDYLRNHENSAEAHVLLGLVRFQQDQPAESLSEFSLAARITPPGANELVIVALDYLKLKDLHDADKWMSAALEKEPANAQAWRYLGGIKVAENRFSEAIDAYKRCLQLQPKDVLAEDGLGRSYEGLSRDEDAASAYRRAIDMQARAKSKQSEPLLHLGTLLIHQAQAQAAIPYLQAAAAIDPAEADAHQQLGEAYTRLNQLNQAQAELEWAIVLAPQEAHLHWLLAEVYRKQGATEKAKEETTRFSALLASGSNGKAP